MGSLQLFIRHPEQIAIELTPSHSCSYEHSAPSAPALGLICSSPTPFTKGSALNVNFPEAPFTRHAITGTVLKCTPQHQHYELAIEFNSADSTMHLRMVEQQAYISLYQQHIAHYQGRILSEDAAALEWIERYAAWFPGSNG